MSLAHIGALIEADNRARVEAETFGHLAPERDKTYEGTILFAHSWYGEGSVPITAEFVGLEDSPWFYDGMCTFLVDHQAEHGKAVYGKVFRWTGTYTFRNWPTIWDEAGNDTIQEAGHEHIFTGEFVEIVTGQ
jgi:hypothetical protein